MGDGMKRVSALLFSIGRTLGAVFQGQIECRAPALTITDTSKSSSEVYGKTEGFTSSAV
jgi:hypothetical protein